MVRILILAIIFVYLFTAALIDYKKQIIPNWLNLIMFILRFAVFTIYPITIGHFAAAILGGLIFLIPSLVLKQETGGDIKMAAVLGLWLGIENLLPLLITATVFTALFLLTTKKKGVPFAPSVFSAMIFLSCLQILSF